MCARVVSMRTVVLGDLWQRHHVHAQTPKSHKRLISADGAGRNERPRALARFRRLLCGQARWFALHARIAAAATRSAYRS